MGIYRLSLVAFCTLNFEKLASRCRNKNVALFHAATNSNFLILIPCMLNFFLQSGHASILVIFFVTFAGFASFGNFCPPYPFLSSACRRSPIADARRLPALYMETFWSVCLRHFGQYLIIALGYFICNLKRFCGVI